MAMQIKLIVVVVVVNQLLDTYFYKYFSKLIEVKRKTKQNPEESA